MVSTLEHRCFAWLHEVLRYLSAEFSQLQPAEYAVVASTTLAIGFVLMSPNR